MLQQPELAPPPWGRSAASPEVNGNLPPPVFLPQKNLILLPPERPYLLLCPSTPPTIMVPMKDGSQRPMAVVRNAPGINQLLGNMGHEIPSPILHDAAYDWSGSSPFLTQKITAGLMVARARAFILNSLGTGKTRAALLAIDWLILQGLVRRALVVAPLSTLWSVWEREIRYRMPRLRPIVIHAARADRIRLLRSSDWNIGIINHDGVKNIQASLLTARCEALVIDELAIYRERRTDRWKKMKPLVEQTPFVWGMTGSPTPNGPWDAYAQVKLLRPERVGNSFTAFRDSVAFQAYAHQWKPRTGAETTIFNLMQPAVRFTLSQVQEIPDTFYLTRTCNNSMLQESMVARLRRHYLVEYDEGRVTAANAAVMLGKLVQGYAGAVYTEDRSVVDLDAQDRLDTLQEIIAEAEAKVIVFLPYRHLCDLVPAKLGYTPGAGQASAMVHGGTPAKLRADIFTDFQDPHSPTRILFAHPGCMAHGLTLTCADTIVWWCPITSYETYEQACGRIIRVGQERVQRIVHITSGSTIESRLYATLEHRGSMQGTILKLFEQRLQ